MPNQLKTTLIVVFLCAMSQFCALGKTVHWDEEVPLNTGETIWIKRTVEYALRGASGNPFDIAYRPDPGERLEFTWRHKSYVFESEAVVFLLAISPNDLPVLVARAADRDWELRHAYKCTTPSYVQFVPTSTANAWSWPPAIEPWLYGLSANLMRTRKSPGEMKGRYFSVDRDLEDAGIRRQSPTAMQVMPTFTFNVLCKTIKP